MGCRGSSWCSLDMLLIWVLPRSAHASYRGGSWSALRWGGFSLGDQQAVACICCMRRSWSLRLPCTHVTFMVEGCPLTCTFHSWLPFLSVNLMLLFSVAASWSLHICAIVLVTWRNTVEQGIANAFSTDWSTFRLVRRIILSGLAFQIFKMLYLKHAFQPLARLGLINWAEYCLEM